MLPYFSVASCTNYSRWMPAYILHMLELPDEIRSAFKDDPFAIRRTPGKLLKTQRDQMVSLVLRVRSNGLLKDIV